VKKLIAGPGVYICDECIGLCNVIIESETGEVPRPTLEHLLKTMPKRPAVKAWVGFCITAGATWDQIGAELGLSASEAERRYATSPPDGS
jgi:hypothetical protein